MRAAQNIQICTPELIVTEYSKQPSRSADIACRHVQAAAYVP
jgi:hypothetical protein